MGDVVDGGIGQGQSGRPRQPDGGRRVEVEAVGEEPVVVGVGPGQGEHPPVLGHPGRPGGSGRAEDERRPLVDLHVGREQLGVRIVDHPVAGRRGDELVGRPDLAAPGVGVGRRHLGEAGPEGTDAPAVLVEGAAGLGPQRVLEQRVHVDGQVEPALLLGVGGAPPVRPEHGRTGGVGRLHRPGQQGPVGITLHRRLGVDAVGADHHGHVQVAAADGQRGGVDHALRVVPARRGHHQLGRLDAQLPGHRQAGIQVLPAQRIGHPERLGRRHQRAARTGPWRRAGPRRSPRWRPGPPPPSSRSVRVGPTGHARPRCRAGR